MYDTMRSVNIEVYCTTSRGQRDLFAVLSEHRADLPPRFDSELQDWAADHFGDLEQGAQVPEAGDFVYEPNGEILAIHRVSK